jgi:ubiquinone/menaquinone biosynthesis C-methylase UbiE
MDIDFQIYKIVFIVFSEEVYSNLRVLDLGCGKGAVSVKLAAALKCNCYGIDGISEFIETSKEKAKEYGVDALCCFEVGDIREEVDALENEITGAILVVRKLPSVSVFRNKTNSKT